MNNAQLYIGNDLLDFNDEVNIKLQCYDMRSSEIGNSNKTYTLEIPLTRRNKTILEHVNMINSRKQVTERARLLLGGIELIRGFPRVFSILSESIRVIIDSDDWVDDISGVSLRDLSWAGGDQHTFNATNIENSWAAANGALYRYPLINFATLYTEEFGLDSGIIPNDFVAMWNISQIVTKIFEDAGYTLATGFFDVTATKNYYILSEEQAAESDFIQEKGLDVKPTNDTENRDSISHTGSAVRQVTLTANPISHNTETLDEGNDYNTTTDKYTIPVTGTYRFKAQMQVNCNHNSDSDYVISTQTANFYMYKNAGTIATLQLDSVTAFDASNVYNLDSGWIFCEAGDTINTLFSGQSTAMNNGATRTVYLGLDASNTSLENTWDDRNLFKGVGCTVDPAEMLPDIDSLDFLIALKEMFNLRFWFDQYNRTIYIQDDPNFVGATVVDWTEKVDYSKQIPQEIIASSYKKNQVWQYKPDDSDKAYTDHVAEYGIPFKKELTLTNSSVLKGTDTRQNTIFSPTVVGNMAQIGHYLGYIPKILGGDEFVSNVQPYPAYRAKKWNPRILSWVSATSSLGGSGSWEWYESMQDFLDGVSTNKTTFPKVVTKDYSDLYDDHWDKSFHYIDGSRMITPTLILKPHELMAFVTKVGTAANEGFRATYKMNVGDVDMYFYLTQIISDGAQGKSTSIQKM